MFKYYLNQNYLNIESDISKKILGTYNNKFYNISNTSTV